MLTEDKTVYRAAIFPIGTPLNVTRLKLAREKFVPILVVGQSQEWELEKGKLLQYFEESEFFEDEGSTFSKLALAVLPRFRKLGLFDVSPADIWNLAEELEEGTWRGNHPAIVINYDQLTFLHNLFMSEMIPGTGGRLGYMATWKLVQSFVPGVTYHQATRAVRHFADALSVSFDQFVRILVFFLKNIDEYDKEAEPAIDYVLRGEKDMGMQSTGAILIRMYEDLLDKDDASYEAFKQIYTQSTISVDTVKKIRDCLLRPRALKKFSKKALEPERHVAGNGSPQEQERDLQWKMGVVVDIDQIRYDGTEKERERDTTVRVLIDVCDVKAETDFYSAPSGLDVLVAQRKTLEVRSDDNTGKICSSESFMSLATCYIKLTVSTTSVGESWNAVYVPIIPLLFRTPRPIVFRSIFTSKEKKGEIQGWFKVHIRHDLVFQRDFRFMTTEYSRKIPLYRRLFSDCLSYWILRENKIPDLTSLIVNACKFLEGDYFLVCGNTDFQPEYCLAYRTKNGCEVSVRQKESGEAEMLDVNLSKQANSSPQVIQKVGYQIAVWRLCPRRYGNALSYMSTVDPNTRVDVVCKVSDIKNHTLRGYMNIQESMNLFEIQWDLEDTSNWFEMEGMEPPTQSRSRSNTYRGKP